MSTFHYSGRNSQGESVKGILERSDASAVVDYLSKQQIIPITIHEDNKNSILNAQAIQLFVLSKKVSSEEMIMFCRQMYTINKAGLPIAQGMKALGLSMPTGRLQSTVNEIVIRLESGSSLSSAMRFHTAVFDRLFISLVQVGEDSGNLDKVFLQLAHYIERDVETKKSIQAAMRYPSFVITAMALAIVALNLWVIPAFSSMFSRFNAELPIATKILIGMSHFFVDYWWLVLLFLVLIITCTFYWIKTDKGRLLWDQKKLSLPIVGSLLRKASLARYTRSFSVMLQAGVPLGDAIGLCSKVIHNRYFELQIENIKKGVERGESLLKTHTRSGIFSPLILQMINVGESSGQIDSLLLDVADFYDKEVEYDLKSLSSKIEPLLIIFMSVFVLILALGIFLPMWEMYNIQK